MAEQIVAISIESTMSDAPSSCQCTSQCMLFEANKTLGQRMTPGQGNQICTIFHIPRMDCPAEEQMVRLSLSTLPVMSLAFDLPKRTLTIVHSCDVEAIHQRLLPLGYGARIMESEALAAALANNALSTGDATEARVLWSLLAVNAAMFLIEICAGWWAHSAGLISDAMDMFADAAVYGVALYAVGRTARHKLTAARVSGALQLLLGVSALLEVGRRIIEGTSPTSQVMIAISVLALVANAGCLYLISRHRDKGVHMKASYIFSANDVLANLGVIIAGVLVMWMNTPWPDWIIGALIGAILLVGSLRILRLR